MNRRSFLRLLAIAPVATPAAIIVTAQADPETFGPGWELALRRSDLTFAQRPPRLVKLSDLMQPDWLTPNRVRKMEDMRGLPENAP